MNITTETNPGAASAGGQGRDAALLAKAKACDREALGEIYESTYAEVWRTIRALVKNEDDALDVLQDTYLKAFTRLAQVRDAESLRPWLRQAAANTARDHLRKKKPALFSELQDADDDEPFADLPDDRLEALPEQQLDRQETQRLVREMLSELSEEQRLVVGMYYYQELPVKEIAEQLGIAQSTVKVQLRNGRQKIEKRVRALEKQGVKLYGAAPLVFFRLLYKRSMGASELPTQLGRLGGELATKSASASAQTVSASAQTVTPLVVKTVTAKGLVVRRVLAGVAAALAIGGLAVGTGLAVRYAQRFGDVQPTQPTFTEHVETDSPDETAETVGRLADGETWEQALLGVLAGKAPEDLGAHERLPQEELTDALGYEADRANHEKMFFLRDDDGDGVPALFVIGSFAGMRFGLEGDTVTYTQADPAAAEGQELLTYAEIVDRLGGFPAGEDWAYGRSLYESMSRTYQNAFESPVSDTDSLSQALERDFPAAKYGEHSGSEWQYAVVRAAEEWSPLLLAIYQQTPEEGGGRFLGSRSYDSDGAEGWRFCQIAPEQPGDVLCTKYTELCCLRAVPTAEGEGYVMLYLGGVPDVDPYAEPYDAAKICVLAAAGEEPDTEPQYQKLLLRSRAELLEKLSESGHDYMLDQGELQTLSELVGTEASTQPYLLSQPALLLAAALPEEAGRWAGADLEVDETAGKNEYDGKTLRLRAVRETSTGSEELSLTLDTQWDRIICRLPK